MRRGADLKILLLGKTGQIGQELQRALPILGELSPLGRAEVDLSDQDGLRHALALHRPDVIVNAAAHTDVDAAESERDLCAHINTDAVDILARHAHATGALLVQYSTDYVFDGAKSSPYTESDAPNPRNVYGLTKLGGEAAILASGCDALILRCSWVYAAHGRNFPNTVLRLARTRDTLDVVADQIGAPTSAARIARITAKAIQARREQGLPSGIYHLAASGSTTWHAYARYLVVGAAARGMPLRLSPDRIHAVASKDYPSAAIRPHNSRMDSSRLARALEIHLPDWSVDVGTLLDELSQREPDAREKT